jgi:hypothetical protein
MNIHVHLALIIFVVSTTTGHRLTLDHMGKCSNAFFSETTNMINAKLYMNVHIIQVVSEKKHFETLFT